MRPVLWLGALAFLLPAVVAAAGGVVLSSDPATFHERPLRLVVCPAHDLEYVRREYLPFVDHLQRELSRRVRFFPMERLGRLSLAVRKGWIDAGVCSSTALEELEARGLRDRVRIVAAQVLNTRERYAGVVVVRATSKAQSLDDLRGRVLAVPDARSECAYRRIERALAAKGATPQHYFQGLQYAGGHTEALRLLLEGGVDAAALSELALARADADGLDSSRLRVVHRTEGVPFACLWVSRDLEGDAAQRLTVAVLAYKQKTPGGTIMEFRRCTDGTW